MRRREIESSKWNDVTVEFDPPQLKISREENAKMTSESLCDRSIIEKGGGGSAGRQMTIKGDSEVSTI